MNKKSSILITLLLLIGLAGFAQENRVELIGADQLLFHKEISGAQRLIGNVKFKYGETNMYCDSAWFYPKEDFFDAWGNIRIIGETERLFGDSLHIDQKEEIARLTGKVRMTDGEMNLTTNRVDYDLQTKVASYFGGGTIVSSKNNDRLTSDQGFYDTESKFFHFRNDVVLKNPEYTITSDTLKYSSLSEKAWFLGPTTIVSENSTVYCENGWYESSSQKCQFSQNARIISDSSDLSSDSIFYDGTTAIGEMFGNVSIQDTSSNYIISGGYGWYNENSSKSYVTDRALLTQIFENDSLYLHADTLRSQMDTTNKRIILAYNNVRFFKSDLQGKSDSLTYVEKDSILTFFDDPVLWSEDNQIVGDTIYVTMKENRIDKLIVDQKAFVIAKVDEFNYNQIKGRELTGKFKDNALHTLYVEGNVEVVFFPESEEDDNKKKGVIGCNKIECSNLEMTLKDSEIVRIKILETAKGKLHPMSKLTKEERILKDFNWQGELRPKSVEDLFISK